MWELIIQIEAVVLDSEETLAPIIEALRSLPGLGDEGHYDMNRHGVWRAIDDRKMLVDALTQRTQLLEIRTQGGGLAMVAMGKHGERPAAAVQLPEAIALEAIVEAWGALFVAGASKATISSSSWREEVRDLAAQPSLGGLPVQVVAWRRGRPALELGGQQVWRERGDHVELWMGQAPLSSEDKVAIGSVWEKLATMD